MVSKYNLMLFVADDHPLSILAMKNLRSICDQYLQGKYTLQIIDTLEEPDFALENNVFITPMLIVATPVPPMYVAGDLSNTGRVLAALRIKEA